MAYELAIVVFHQHVGEAITTALCQIYPIFSSVARVSGMSIAWLLRLLCLLLLLLLVPMLIEVVRGRFRVSWEEVDRVALALDLDETLVRSDLSAGTVTVRPGVAEFLAAVSGMFDEVSVFTAGTYAYARPIVDQLEEISGVPIRHRLYRDACTPVLSVPAGEVIGYAKDLRMVSKQTGCERVLLLDNTPMAYSLQPESGVAIQSFYGDPSDSALADTLPVLARRLDEIRQTQTACARSANRA